MKKVGFALSMALYGAFICFALVYIVLCMINGWNWAIEIASTYFLMIIRAIVVIFLGLISIIALPFTNGAAIIYYGKFGVMVGLALGFLFGLFSDLDEDET